MSIIDRCATMLHNCLVKLRCKKSLEGMAFQCSQISLRLSFSTLQKQKVSNAKVEKLLPAYL